MNKFVIMALLALSGIAGLYAGDKGSVTGVVREMGSLHPMECATVSIHRPADGKIVTGCMTDSLGRFVSAELPEGEYYVEVNYVGASPVRTDVFPVGRDQSVDVGNIDLSDSQLLNEVVVEGRKPQLVSKPDKKIYNASQDLVGAAGSASDIMQNIPSVDVDMDGVVSLRGNSNVTILVNGKPSALMGARTRGDALNQLSASNIERIEVITNPSAEYKPDGVSGIINIILKKEVKRGLNGSVTANIGSYNRQNAGINANYAFKNMNFFGGYAYRRDRYDRSVVDRRISPADVIRQNTCGLGRPISHTARLGVGAALSDRDMIEISGSYDRRLFRRNESIESVTEDAEGNRVGSYTRIRNAFARENMWEATLRYSHGYGASNEWGIDYVYSSGSEDEINHYSTVKTGVKSLNDETVWDANYVNMAKLFWKHNLTDRMRFMGGYEVEHLRAEQSYHVSDWNGMEFVHDSKRSSDFTHRMLLNSVYGTVEWGIGRWSLLAGVRGEYARISNRLLSSDGNMTRNYFNLFPSLHISRAVGTDNELTLSYGMRINRPEGKDMNPFAEQINPLSLESGNPDLKPEKINSLEVGWIWRTPAGCSLLSTVYYRHISDKITSVSRYIESGVLLTTKENMQTSQNAGVELVWDVPVVRWFGFNLNFNGYYNEIDASGLGFGKKKSTVSWSALLNADFRPFRHSMLQMNARYRSATLVPQGKRDGDLRINLGVKYDIPKINMSITASVTDLFDTYRKSYTLDTPELKQTVKRRRNPRIFYIGLAWQFGGIGKGSDAKLEYDEGL